MRCAGSESVAKGILLISFANNSGRGSEGGVRVRVTKTDRAD